MGTTRSFRFLAPIKRGGRAGFILYNGKKGRAKVSGRRTRITIKGKKAKRKAAKTGMNSLFNYPGADEEAKNIAKNLAKNFAKNLDCKS